MAGTTNFHLFHPITFVIPRSDLPADVQLDCTLALGMTIALWLVH